MRKKLLTALAVLCAFFCLIGAGCTGESKESVATSYTVTFEGEGFTSFTQTVLPGGVAIAPKAPERKDYIFNGWYKGSTKYDFATPVNENITLTANWSQVAKVLVNVHTSEGVTQLQLNKGEKLNLESFSTEREGFEFEGWVTENGALYDFNATVEEDLTVKQVWANGSKENPYRIYTAEDLIDFSEKVNHTSGKYYDKYYSLEANIDMTGIEYTPAGAPVLDADGYIERYGFSGVFYGNNHKISNLSQSQLIRNKSGNFYMGLFATTSLADIRDLTLENFSYEMISYNPERVNAYIGGVVAYSRLTNMTNVKVSGEIIVDMMNDNYICAGGIAGGLYADADNGQAYIVYVENCYANVDISVAEEGAFENGAAGGLYGFVQTYSSAVAVINCSSAGKVAGGMFTGGLIGSVSDYTSIINCYSSSQVQPTASEVSYAGGLIGDISGDSMVIDSLATGIVIGKEGTSTTYNSYVGGLVGHAYKDDYNYYYSAGAVILNSYYSGNVIRNGVIKSDWGSSISSTEVNKNFALNTLKWSEQSWNLKDFIPTKTLANQVNSSPEVDFVSKGEIVESKTYESDGYGYALLGELIALENQNGFVFFDWEYQTDLLYRFYMPVVKDMTLTARWQDVKEVSGAYKGEAKLENSGNPINSGTIILKEDGSVEWVQGSVNVGSYVYNGEVIIIEIFNSTGTLFGTLVNGNLAFTADAGITGTVYYNFSKYEPQFIGEYISDGGDILTFKDDANLSFESAYIKNGDYISATYTLEGNLITINGLSKYFASATATVNEDGSLTANFRPATGSEYALDQVLFTKPGKIDYSNQPFVGEYNVAYVSSSRSYVGGEEIFRVDYYTLTFNANGTVVYSSIYSDTVGRYYFVESNSTIKMMLEGYMSIFYYDAKEDIIWGNLSRGATSILPVVITPTENGKLYAYAMDSRLNVVFKNDVKAYFVENAVYDPDAVISGSFAGGKTVTVNGKEYYVNVIESENTYDYYDLTLIGAEKGRYSFDGKVFELNGFGIATGAMAGEYLINGTTVILLTKEDQIIGFNYESAKQNAGEVTLLEQDGYQGVWYMDAMRYTYEKDYMVEDYYKLVVDGYGNTAVYYLSDYGYRLNWGGVWGSYTLVPGGIHAIYNSSQIVTLYPYYDMNVLYSSPDSAWIIKEASFAKKGYNGPLTPPVMPVEYAGSYYDVSDEGQEVIFNLKENLSGSFKGALITKVSYDGTNKVMFTANSISYTFTYGDTCTIAGGGVVITVAKGGVVTEIYPSDLVGTWSGVWSGMGVTEGEIRSIRIQKDGFIYYVVGTLSESLLSSVEYDSVKGVITGYSGALFITLTYNVEEDTISFVATDDENREWEATLTKE